MALFVIGGIYWTLGIDVVGGRASARIETLMVGYIRRPGRRASARALRRSFLLYAVLLELPLNGICLQESAVVDGRVKITLWRSAGCSTSGRDCNLEFRGYGRWGISSLLAFVRALARTAAAVRGMQRVARPKLRRCAVKG